MAGEAVCPFSPFPGSDFVEMFVGAGASVSAICLRRREEELPVSCSSDEIDAAARRRVPGMAAATTSGVTLNQLLVETRLRRERGIIVSGGHQIGWISGSRHSASANKPTASAVAGKAPMRGREEILKVHAGR